MEGCAFGCRCSRNVRRLEKSVEAVSRQLSAGGGSLSLAASTETLPCFAWQLNLVARLAGTVEFGSSGGRDVGLVKVAGWRRRSEFFRRHLLEFIVRIAGWQK